MKDYHDAKGFKFFSFSDFFPSGDLPKGGKKSIMFSSPDQEIVLNVKKGLERSKILYLKDSVLNVTHMELYAISSKHNTFISGSPVVLYKDNDKNLYFSFGKGGNFEFFMNRIKENAEKKYRQFTGMDSFSLSEPIFDSFQLRKEVAVRLSKSGKDFIMIGTVWKILKKERISHEKLDFYRFIADTGIGEKNSLGFGFLNPLEEKYNAK
ncbi:MAG: CRISPR-associated endoribonuclease Cas6 [Thermoplasmataceae archaeon]